MANSLGYFAAREADEAVAAIENKVELWRNTIEATGYMSKLRDMYAAYHGAYYNSVGEAHQINFGGDDDELVEIALNHFHNIAQHMLTMMTSSRPAMECRAMNTDAKSLIQTQLGNGLLDYYMREKKIEEIFKDACEYAIVLGSGWVKLSWNASLGSQINADEIEQARQLAGMDEEIEIPAKEYEGDIEVEALSPLDIILDLSKENMNHDWVICRSYKNRYDLIAKYPELESEIEGIESKDNLDRLSVGPQLGDTTDDIPVFEFFHKRTAAMPEGRYIFFASSDAIFYDSDLPYKKIPVYPVYPARVLGTPLGYSPLFNLLSIQDAQNSLVSSVLSNNVAFATQNVLVPTGSNIEVSQIGGALNVLNYNPQAGKPEAMQLTASSPETYRLIDMFTQAMETLSGMNSVVRGNPEASLRSGSAIAMIQSNAIQFMSGLQASYTYLIENVGLGLFEILQEFAHSPRIANIVGESGKSYVKEFKSDDIMAINRVTVDSANPLTKTVAGRTQMADNLLQYQLLTDPQQYLNVINTGRLDVATEDSMKKFNLIRGENEQLLMGLPQRAMISDHHQKHIQSHLSLLDDPIFRDLNNPEVAQMYQNVVNHVMEHKELWISADPVILAATGQQPPPAPAAPAAPPQGPAPADVGAMPPEAAEVPANLPPVDQAVAAQGAVPQNVRLPEGFEDIPLSPEQNMANIRG